MKAEIVATAKVRPAQDFDPEKSGWCHEHRHTDSTHVGTVVLPGKVIVRLPLCDECARTWIVAGQIRRVA